MRRSPLLWVSAVAAYAFLYIPLVVVVIFSFNDSKLNAEWVGFTLDWYRKLIANDEMLKAALNSLIIAFAARGSTGDSPFAADRMPSINTVGSESFTR